MARVLELVELRSPSCRTNSSDDLKNRIHEHCWSTWLSCVTDIWRVAIWDQRGVQTVKSNTTSGDFIPVFYKTGLQCWHGSEQVSFDGGVCQRCLTNLSHTQDCGWPLDYGNILCFRSGTCSGRRRRSTQVSSASRRTSKVTRRKRGLSSNDSHTNV